MQTAQQIASARQPQPRGAGALDAINRVSLIKTLADQEGVRILPREPSDKWEPLRRPTRWTRAIGDELSDAARPGHRGRQQASTATTGLWVGFSIDTDPYWMLLDPTRVGPSAAAPGWSG